MAVEAYLGPWLPLTLLIVCLVVGEDLGWQEKARLNTRRCQSRDRVWSVPPTESVKP